MWWDTDAVVNHQRSDRSSSAAASLVEPQCRESRWKTASTCTAPTCARRSVLSVGNFSRWGCSISAGRHHVSARGSLWQLVCGSDDRSLCQNFRRPTLLSLWGRNVPTCCDNRRRRTSTDYPALSTHDTHHYCTIYTVAVSQVTSATPTTTSTLPQMNGLWLFFVITLPPAHNT